MAFALQIPLKQDQWWEEVTVSKTELLKAGTATSSLVPSRGAGAVNGDRHQTSGGWCALHTQTHTHLCSSECKECIEYRLLRGPEGVQPGSEGDMAPWK